MRARAAERLEAAVEVVVEALGFWRPPAQAEPAAVAAVGVVAPEVELRGHRSQPSRPAPVL